MHVVNVSILLHPNCHWVGNAGAVSSKFSYNKTRRCVFRDWKLKRNLILSRWGDSTWILGGNYAQGIQNKILLGCTSFFSFASSGTVSHSCISFTFQINQNLLASYWTVYHQLNVPTQTFPAVMDRSFSAIWHLALRKSFVTEEKAPIRGVQMQVTDARRNEKRSRCCCYQV